MQIMKKIILLFAMMMAVGTVSAETVKLYATFGTPASNASYNAETNTYSWTDTSNNLMECFTFSNGELANCTTLMFAFSDNKIDNEDKPVRINLLFSDGKSVDTNSGFYTAGTKTITLSEVSLTKDEVSHTLADVTAIRFGGCVKTSGSAVVKASDMYLERSIETTTLSATFGIPANSAAYGGYYAWTGSTSNLMDCFTFSGNMGDYSKLCFTIKQLSTFEDNGETKYAPVRVGYYKGSTWTELGSGFYNDGDKEVSLSGIETPADVTKICFGGKDRSSGNVMLTNMYVEKSDETKLYATYGTPGSNATFTANTYKWTSSSSNLMDVFTFSNGELANYTTLTFTFSDLTDDASVRMGYKVSGSDTFNEFGTGFYSAGTKTVDLSGLGVNLSTVTKICFGGRSNSGSCVIKAEDVTLSNATLITGLTRQFTKDRKSTVCLPFDLTEAEATAAGKFYTLSSVDGTTLTFTEVADPAAYTPYVFVPATEYPFAFLNKSIASSVGKTCQTVVGDYTFQGVMVAGNVPQGAYGYNAENGAFSKTTSGNVDIAACRAYIKYTGSEEGSVKSLTAVFNDDATTTAIQQMQSAAVSKAMYNLAGQRVGSGYKGIAIVNGKKVLMK